MYTLHGLRALARSFEPDKVRLFAEPDQLATRDLIVQENRRYARRQLIWFRKEPNLIWFDGPGERPETMRDVERAALEQTQRCGPNVEKTQR